MESVIVTADAARISGSAEELIKLVTDSVAKGIHEQHSRVVELYKPRTKALKPAANT